MSVIVNPHKSPKQKLSSTWGQLRQVASNYKGEGNSVATLGYSESIKTKTELELVLEHLEKPVPDPTTSAMITYVMTSMLAIADGFGWEK